MDEIEQLENKHRMFNKCEQKKCSHCGEWLALDQFSGRKASKDGLSYNCRTCERAIAKDSYKKTRTRKKNHDYYANNRDQRLVQSHENYLANRDTRLAQAKKYREEHPEVFRKADRKRQELLRNTEREPYTREEIIERDSEIINGTKVPVCQICHKPILPDQELHIDHIIPVAEGGADMKSNVRAVHKLCNITRPKDGRDLKVASTSKVSG